MMHYKKGEEYFGECEVYDDQALQSNTLMWK